VEGNLFPKYSSDLWNKQSNYCCRHMSSWVYQAPTWIMGTYIRFVMSDFGCPSSLVCQRRIRVGQHCFSSASSLDGGWCRPLNSHANCCLADVLVIKLELSYIKRYNGIPFGTNEIYVKYEYMSDITLLIAVLLYTFHKLSGIRFWLSGTTLVQKVLL
jgi:hypothetical protein